MIGNAVLAVILCATFVILMLSILVPVLRIRNRRTERKRQWQQLGSVYDHQERRMRGDR